MQTLLSLHVLVLLHTLVLIGQIKLTVKSGTLTEVVLGLLVIHVLLITETNLAVRHNLVVLMILLHVLLSEMSLVVIGRLDVLGRAMIVLY